MNTKQNMKPVKTIQKYKCDFCKRRSTKSSMEAHEKICFRNPKRFCELCKNTGEVIEDINGDGSLVSHEPCFYCSKFDPKMKAEIETREKKLRENNQVMVGNEIVDLPF